MKRKITFLSAAFMLLAFLAIPLGMRGQSTYTIGWGTASGEEGTYTNFAATSGEVAGVLSFITEKNNSQTNPAYNANSSELRLYYHSSGNGGSITITPAQGVTITDAIITTSTSPSVAYYVDGGTAVSVSASSNTYTISGISAASSLKIQNANTSNTQLRIKTIALTYTTAGGGGDTPVVPDYEVQISEEELNLSYQGNANGVFNLVFTNGFVPAYGTALLYADAEAITDYPAEEEDAWLTLTNVYDYGSMNYPYTTVTYMVGQNNGDARTVYLKVELYDNAYNTVEGVFAVTQEAAPTPVATYSVLFNLNAEDAVFEPNEVFANVNNEVEAGTYALPSATREGFTFNGWSDGNTTYAGGADYDVTAEVTFTAQWTENTTPTPGGGEVTFDATVDLGNTAAGEGSIVKDGVTFYCSNGILGNGTEYRIYKNATVTFSVTSGTITNIEFTCTSSNPASGFATMAGFTTNGNNGTWTGSAESVTFTASNKQVRATQIVVTVNNGGTPAPSITIENNNEIAYNATEGSFNFSVNNPVDNATLSVSEEVEWIYEATINGNAAEGYTVTFNTTQNDAGTPREGVITLTYAYGDNQTVTTSVAVTQAGDPNVTPTIAEVRTQGTGSSVVTRGIVTSCVGVTGYIQDATAAICVYGTELTVGDEIRVSGTLTTYKGLLEIAGNDLQVTVLSSGNVIEPQLMTVAEAVASQNQGWYIRIENATVSAIDNKNVTIAQGDNSILVYFNSTDDITFEADDVISLNGNIGCYNNTTQIANPQNVEVQEAPAAPGASITINPAFLTLDAEMHDGYDDFLPITYKDIIVENAQSFGIQFYTAEGEETETVKQTSPWLCFYAMTSPWFYAWGSAQTGNDAYQVSVAAMPNDEGEARSVYFKVYAYDADSTLVYSNLAIVTQAASGDIFFYKDIAGYGQAENGHYYLIASPVASNVTPSVENGFLTNEYDLYWFDQTEDKEWRNYEAGEFDLVSGMGYLYASQKGTTLTFIGTPYDGDGSVSLVKDDEAQLKGWNLVGNPFGETAYIDRDFYVMNEAGTEILTDACTGAVEAMQGVFVIAEQDGETLTFTNQAPVAAANVTLNLSQNRGAVIDRTIVRFGEGRQLPKFQLNTESTKLYIPQGNEDFAVVRSAAYGEMPVNFKAQSNGTYTISVNAENVEASYLHLIDNMTGNDIDLLATPSYTFEATTSDYVSRFRLVFNITDVEENMTSTEPFAFFNGSEWVISNTGAATLQVVDVMGRVLSTESINGNATANVNQVAGIYMLRLVNGDNVRVQKIVVK